MANQDEIAGFLQLLRGLMVPDERPRIVRTLLRRRRPLPPPMVCLVAEEAGPLLEQTHDWLGRSSNRAVPRAYVDVGALPAPALTPDTASATRFDGEESTENCLPVLEELSRRLISDNTAMGPIEFPRYHAADWLTRQRSAGAPIDAAELRARLPRLLRIGRRDPETNPSPFGALGATIERIALAIWAVVPIVRLWLWVSGLVPGVSREPRWFMRQRYLAPELSDSFLGFALRLTEQGRERENHEQIAKLLVHAFLSDLGEAYRRRLLRPSSWRRTAYPVALLDGVGHNGQGADLLRWINDIRNETGRFDPLVVIAAVDRAPTGEEAASLGDLARPVGADRDPLGRWRDTIEVRRRNRDATAWYLPLRMPDPADVPRGDLGENHLARPPAPPWAARRSVVAAVAVVPVVALVAAAAVYVHPRNQVGCTAWPFWSGVGVAVRDGECVGYSDNARQIFADDPELSEMQREVFRQNAIADRIRRANPNRPMVALVYFAGLTYADRNMRYPHAQVEELAGLVLRQRGANAQSSEAEPLLRIVIANGGSGMRQASWVVDNLLSDLIREDSDVLGVIGLDRSNAETRRAIARLGDLGVPTFGTTLSADGLDAVSPTYFQAAPSNRVQARLVAGYVAGARYPEGTPRAGQPRYDKVTVFHPDNPDDIYVHTLVADVLDELGARGIPADTFSWSRQQELYGFPPPCARSDPGEGELLYFAGRNNDFGAFVNAVTRECHATESPPILGNDAVTRFIADPVGRQAIPAGLSIRYVAKGVPVMLAGPGCVQGRGVLGDESVGLEFQDLCASLAELIEDLDLYRTPWPGDRTGLSYDVAGAFLQAVRANRARPEQSSGEIVLSRTAIALELRGADYTGITGVLRLTESRVAEDATIGVLMAEDLSSDEVAPRCLLMFGTPVGDTSGRGADGCPAGTHSPTEVWQPR
ncbi:hypothetical protein [Nocardia cyriacigeorgica]|uniref:Uncharacterized protein n=1 Tax=Nocardia cyriacigeorgica (strain GUH-2) TaxID=1127134 RepID=H6R7V4_NOCCG|nr:hypothetical protein [Nocardia cyriacigeorgica]CCF62298.1 conserved protein of unknown function [Nocardia cyriacigeorgica GUH-2]